MVKSILIGSALEQQPPTNTETSGIALTMVYIWHHTILSNRSYSTDYCLNIHKKCKIYKFNNKSFTLQVLNILSTFFTTVVLLYKVQKLFGMFMI